MASKVKETDRGLNSLLKQVGSIARGTRATVGIQGVKARAVHSGNVTNVELGTIHEFGAPKAGIPSRSFLRAPADERKAHWKKRLTDELGKAMAKRQDFKAPLMRVGEEFRTAVIDRIKAGISPPLKQPRAKEGGALTSPLIDTGALMGSISLEIRTGAKT